MSHEPKADQHQDDARAFATVMVGTVLLGAAAFGLSLLLNTPLGPQIKLNLNGALIGIAAALPPVGFLWWFSNSTIPALSRFRDSQIAFFAGIGFTFTPLRIALMAVGAGVSEEYCSAAFFRLGCPDFSR